MSELKILRASAGSGKTHRLTMEFIELLLIKPENYRHILAVTFTNKASEEMKSRILKELDKLAEGDESDIIEQLCTKLGIGKELLKIKSAEALNAILHDYSRFSVITIDSFFQRCIKAFIRELGIYSNFNIELDAKKILSESVDDLLNKIETDNELKTWVSRYIEERMSESKSIDLKTSITDLGKEILKEEFFRFDDEFIKKLSDKKYIGEYQKEIIRLIKNTEEEYASIGKEALKIIAVHNLRIEDFSYGSSGVAGYFGNISEEFKEPGNRARNAIDNAEAWHAKKSPDKDKIISAFNGGLNNILIKAVDYFENNYPILVSARLIRRYLYALGIIVDLSSTIREYSKENNVFLMSETGRMLQGIIGQSDTPFIYEKIGNYYYHFMIDEFQDTSVLQWNNFKPLILDSLSNDNLSLVVGDVKQSIYRWRNGDWRLLAHQIEKDVIHFGSSIDNLENNWRSSPNIIKFNNEFFKIASDIFQKSLNADAGERSTTHSEILSTSITDLYSGLFQNFPEKRIGKCNDGFINIKFFEEEDAEQDILLKTIETIEYLQSVGHNAGDIAILVRKNDEGKKIVDYIFNYKESENAKPEINYNVISNESLFLKNSIAIKLIINILYHLQSPDDNFYKAGILDAYSKIENSSVEMFDLSFLAYDNDRFFSILPREFSEQIKGLIHLPLYEKIESIINIFDLYSNERYYPYLNALQDLVFDFGQKESHDTSRFLNYWEESGISQSLELRDGQDAIRIITIHKAKGLEFKFVIIPFASWNISNYSKQPFIWCRPDDDPLSKLDLVPLKSSSLLKESTFFEDYVTERMNNYIDNLNMLYVAFTRAREGLFIYSDKPVTNKTSVVINEFIDRIIAEGSDFESAYNEETRELIYGSIEIKRDIKSNISEIAQPEFQHSNSKGRIRIKTSSKDFFTNVGTDKVSARGSGNIMHNLFSMIFSADDVKSAVNNLILSGHLNSVEAGLLETEIRSRIKEDPYKSWFSGEWHILTEEAILSQGGRLKIPDRIMIKDNRVVIIDYKFGDNEDIKHQKQILNYKDLLTEMGYSDIESYLWYYSLDKLLKVS